MKYPLLIEVFKRFARGDFYYFKDKSSPKDRLQKIINDTFRDKKSAEILLNQIDDFLPLVGIVCHRICEENVPDGMEKNVRTSGQKKMRNVLNFEFSNKKLIDQKLYEGNYPLNQASNEELLSYSYELDKTKTAPWKKHFDVAQELFERLEIGTTKDKKFVIVPNFYGEIYSDACYRFMFAISYAIEKVINSQTKEGEKIWQLIQNFLSSEKISIDAKYIFLNGFVNKSRPNSSTGLRLRALFENIVGLDEKRRLELKELIKKVFLDAKNRYYCGSKSVYKHEENFAHVLFQAWNGKKDSPKNINAIRKSAARGLEKCPQAINYYWKIAFDRLDKNSTFPKAEFEFFTPKQLYKITQDSIKLARDKSLKDKLLGNLTRYETEFENDKKIRRKPQTEDYKQQATKPLMMAMIEQGYIDEKVSLFEFESKAKNSL